MFRFELTVSRFDGDDLSGQNWSTYFSFDHGFEGCASATHFALMSVLRVVIMHPLIEVNSKISSCS